MADEPQHVSPRQEFSSGRELIETVKARREQGEVVRAIADEIEVEMGRRPTAATRTSSMGSWCAGSTRDARPRRDSLPPRPEDRAPLACGGGADDRCGDHRRL